MSYKLAIIGSRTFKDYNLLCEEMAKLPKPAVIVSGGAKGADSLGKQYADEHGIPTEIFPAIWRPEGEGGPLDKGAGMKRNTDIIKASNAVLAFWDGDSTGTMDSINKAIMFKKHVKVVYTALPKKSSQKDIYGFQGKDRWLSNMWPVEFEVKGIKFMSVENAYQASKLVGQPELMEKFAKMPALESKKKIKGLPVTTPNFHENKLKFMRLFLKKKFENPCLRQKLINTGSLHIEETNDWGDTFWGCCPQGVGSNYLGKLIMEIREELQKEYADKIVKQELAEEKEKILAETAVQTPASI
jgi:ribA/ribD-fused uncharacterized protein